MVDPMPAIFFGHGNPMNALTQNPYTGAWRKIGRREPRPKAILSMSAHWYRPRNRRHRHHCAPNHPRLRRFPPELYHVQYPAPGDPALARRVQRFSPPSSEAR